MRYATRFTLLAAMLIAVAAPAFGQDVVPGRLIVKFRASTTLKEKADILLENAASVEEEIPGMRISILKISEHANPRSLAARMKQYGQVEFADPDVLEKPLEVMANDPWFANWQAALRYTNCPAAWSITTGSPNVAIAILDSGVYAMHPDLVENMIPGWNAYDNNADTSDVYGHGTKVAGTAAAVGNNGIGVASVAWNCKIMPVRVTQLDGMAPATSIISGLRWAADHGAKVANLSFGLSVLASYDSAFQYFRSKGGLVVSSAGNESMPTGQAQNPYLITVGGTDGNDVYWTGSNYGQNVDVSAPMAVYSTTRTGSYTTCTGTSFSAPMVAGALAMIFSANPSLSVQQAEQTLFSSADDKGTTGWDPYYGYGRINVGKAVAAAGGTVPVDSEPPVVTIESPGSGLTVQGSVQVLANAMDNNAVDRVLLYVDGVLMAERLAPAYGFTWDTKTAANGLHTIKAVAQDTAGNVTETSIQVKVLNQVLSADVVAPSVTLTSPADGTSMGKTVKVTVDASDDVGVVKVECLVDDGVVATSTTAPFAIQFNPRKMASGWHTVQCRAYDAAGNSSLSAAIRLFK